MFIINVQVGRSDPTCFPSEIRRQKLISEQTEREIEGRTNCYSLSCLHSAHLVIGRQSYDSIAIKCICDALQFIKQIFIDVQTIIIGMRAKVVMGSDAVHHFSILIVWLLVLVYTFDKL